MLGPLVSIHLWIQFRGGRVRVDLGDEPPWNLLAISFLLRFLIESIYVWLAIRRLSMADFPVFPKYVSHNGVGEWPTQPYLIRPREWLRETVYEQIETHSGFLD